MTFMNYYISFNSHQKLYDYIKQGQPGDFGNRGFRGDPGFAGKIARHGEKGSKGKG